MSSKPKIVILEGISGCGKSALLHRVNELSNYRDSVVMRFTPSSWVYNDLYHRPIIDYSLIEHGIQAGAEVHVVWLRVDPQEALRRKEAKGDLELIEDLALADRIFEHYFRKITIFENVHEIITMGMSIAETVEEIRQAVYGGEVV